MRKRISSCALTVAIIVLSALFLSSCGNLTDLEKAAKELTQYSVQLSYDDTEKTVKGRQEVDYINSYEVPLDTVCFHIYANAYRQNAEIKPINDYSVNKAYKNGMSYGGFSLYSVDGEDVSEYRMGGTDYDIITVSLLKQLYPGERTKINIDFSIKLANVRHRLGFFGNTVNLGNFLPIASVYSDGSFFNSPYYSNGDPFYSKCANYNITLSLPEDFKGAFTGDIVTESTSGGIKTYTVNALAVRDFAAVLSKDFKVLQGVSESGVDILYYYTADSESDKSLQCAIDSMNTFEEMFGKYPYNQYSVVQTHFFSAGMEYPQLVYIADDIKGSIYLETIIHETAHQWWYAVVGNNQVNHAWMDEALSQYSTIFFYEENPQYDMKRSSLIVATKKSYRQFLDVYAQVTGRTDSSMTRAVHEYRSEYEYVYLIYVKGELMFDALREAIGREKLIKGLKHYYTNNSFKVAEPQHMITSIERGGSVSVEAFFNSWLDGKVII